VLKVLSLQKKIREMAKSSIICKNFATFALKKIKTLCERKKVFTLSSQKEKFNKS
jgi:hypothetical protein